MLGVLIFLGLFGLLLVAWVEGRNFNLRQNRELRVIGNEIVMGKKRADIARGDRGGAAGRLDPARGVPG